jgi:hypothetical protein
VTAPIVVGIDPGPSTTGIVARRGDRLLGHAALERLEQPLAAYAEHVLDETDRIAHHHILPYGIDLYAVEGFNPPTPHLSTVAIETVTHTAWLVGFLQSGFTWLTAVDTVLVPPGQHGRGPYCSYPDELKTAAEQRQPRLKAAGRSSLVSHCRSAWDIAGAAETSHKQRNRAREGA